jgi:crossover junction endodeoxyribonuclease RuvC
MNPSWSSLTADRVIGVDPGLTTTGVAVLECDETGRCRALHIGTIHPPRRLEPAEKLRHLCQEIQALIRLHRPACLAVEETFYHKNVKSALALGQARGAAMVAAAECGLGVMELSAKTVKQAAVGTGGAAKEQVAAMITVILGLSEVPASMDACDAAAVALAALHRRALPEAVRS